MPRADGLAPSAGSAPLASAAVAEPPAAPPSTTEPPDGPGQPGARAMPRLLLAATTVIVAAAVWVVLALLWNRLPAPASGNPGHPAATAAADLPTLDACASLVARAWLASSPVERANDLHLLPLRQAAAACAHSAGAPVSIYLFDPKQRRLVASLHGPSQSGAAALRPERVAAGSTVSNTPVEGRFGTSGTQRITVLSAGLWLVVDRLEPTSGAVASAPGTPWALGSMSLLQTGLAAAALGVSVALCTGLWLLMRARQAELQAWQAQWQAQRAGQAALAREAHYRKDLFDAVGVGLRVVDPAGRLTDVNPAFCSLAGWSAESLLGCSPPYPFWPAAAQARHAQHLQAVLSGQAAAEGYRVQFERPGGQEWTAQVIARPLSEGRGWILACTDVTQEHDARRRVDALNEELRRLSSVGLLGQRAGDLLHQFSNHCGTALHALSAARKQLQAQRPDAAAPAVELALSTVTQLGRVVERFRPWLRDEVNLEPCALHDLTEDALAQEGAYAQRYHVRLVNQVSKDLPALALDRMALCEVLSNLLHNAIGSLADAALSNRRVTVDSFLDNAQQQILLRVCDLGPGIPPQWRERVFERGFSARWAPQASQRLADPALRHAQDPAPGAPFTEGDDRPRPDAEARPPTDTAADDPVETGSGWGLANCRYWVEKLGGTIRITDHAPQGTAVEIRLPLPVHAQATTPLADSTHPQASLEATRSPPPAGEHA